MRITIFALALFTTAVVAAPVISEFMASNLTTLKDGHDNYEDWIEIWNPDATSVDLAGWRLTDSSANLSKFVFPSYTIPAGGRVVVFASNRQGSTGATTHVDAIGYRHTNFSLAKSGEYLALISPAGVVSMEFTPNFPVQLDDISYGPPAVLEAFTSSTSPLRYKVPTATADDTASPNWTQANFTDTAWMSATGSGVGFEVGSPTAAWLLDETAGATSAADFTGGGRTLGLNGTGQTFGASGANTGTATAVQLSGAGGFTVPYSSALNPTATFTFAAWVYPTGGSGHRALVSSRVGPAGQQRGFIIYITPGNTWEFWTGNYPANVWDVTTANTAVTFNAWTHVAITRSANGTKRLYINGAQVAASAASSGNYHPNNNTANGFHLGCGDDLGQGFRFIGKIDDAGFWSSDIGASLITQHMTGGLDTFPTPLYPAHFQSNVQTAMFGVNPGIYTRHNFTVSDKTRYASLCLRAKYDDGYVAYLNGTEILRKNFTGTRSFNSVAMGDRAENDAVVFEDVDVTAAALPAMVNGANLLAIHGMTYVNSATDFLLTPVFGATLTSAAQAPGYFAVATPVAGNSTANVNPGPDISNIAHTPAQPAAAVAVTVTAHVKPRLAPIATVSLKYRVQYGAESGAIAMTDMGPVPFATDGSRIFSGTIPSMHGATARQMLRYYLTATDTSARTWREPYPVDLTNDDGMSQSPEYFGTVIADATLTASMPIIQWFTNDVTNSDTRIGSRASVFYGGLFYDNIYVRQRGGYTSSGSQKFNFNAKDGIYVNATLGKVGELNMNSSGVDPNLFRVSTSYAIYRAAGHPALESFPVAMVRNGTVHRIANLIEQLDEDFLKRKGFDNDGALYKFVQRLGEENTPGNVIGGDYSGSPGFKNENPIYGVEKKTRLYEGFADFSSFTAGIGTGTATDRKNFLLKNLNLPNFVNFMALRALVSDTDVHRKNFYAFRDTIDSQEWYLFPWDKDMSIGTNYSTDVATNLNNPWWATSTYKADPNSTKQWCVLWQAGYDVPEVRAMVGRRLRTLMDTMMGAVGTPIPGSTIMEQKLQEIRTLLTTPPPGYTVNGNYNLRTSFDTWLAQHRTALFTTYGPASGYNMIPTTASALPVVTITNAVANPATATVGYSHQDHEYIEVTNANAEEVDMSGWTLWNPGATSPFFTFPSGTVIPKAASAPLNIMNVVRDQPGFRNRPGVPTVGEFVVGRYNGQLSARGETVQLRDGALVTSRLVSSFSTPPAPTLGQQSLRVTELMFAPTAPNATELLAAPFTEANDYEYIELQNTGVANLDITAVKFTDGVEFTFSATTLTPGQRILLVANLAAFEARYGTGFNIAGTFSGTLDNSGDHLRIEDSVGEMILDFSYNERWFPPSNVGGRSLVVRNTSPNYATYDMPVHWALSGTAGGTPGGADKGDFANHFDGWRWDHYNSGEIYLPTPANPAYTVNTAFVGPVADTEGDGLTNLAEYAFGRQPRTHDNSALSTASIVNDGGNNYLAVTFHRRHKALDLTYTIETTDNLTGPWTPTTQQFSTTIALGNGIEQVTYRDTVQQGATPRFIRIRAVKP